MAEANMEMTINTVNVPKIKLYRKLYKLQQKLFAKQVKKTGVNQYSKYKYSTKEDIIAAVHEELRGCGLIILFDYPSATRIEVNEKTVGYSVDAVIKIIDPETGEQELISFTGYAEDTQDKALWKAYTGIEKYFLVKEFHLQDNDLSTEPENDDPRSVKATTLRKKVTPESVGVKQEEKASTTQGANDPTKAIYEALIKMVTDSETGSVKLDILARRNWKKIFEVVRGTSYEQKVQELFEKMDEDTRKEILTNI